MTSSLADLQAILRWHFASFVEKCFQEVSNSEFKSNWHIDYICQELEDMMSGKNLRLIINIPPRNLKSIICSVALPAFILGHDPKANIICVSYNDELAETLAGQCRAVMSSSWYRDLFSRAALSVDKTAVNDFQTTAGGGRYATSVGGTLTGRGADWIIIDDPIKPTDALSDVQRKKVNDWYGNTLYSRLNDKRTGKILLIMQRLHLDDLCGHILNRSPDIRHIKIPAIATEDEIWKIKTPLGGYKTIIRQKGEALHPEREDLEILQDIKLNSGEYHFCAQYQQMPISPQGNLVKKEWLKYYLEIANPMKELVISWDTASKCGDNNAYSACVIIGIDYNNKWQMLDCFRGRFAFPELLQKAIVSFEQTKSKYNLPVKLLIEDKSSGTQLIQSLHCRRDIDVVSIQPSKDKEVRFGAASVHIQNGNCSFPAVYGNNFEIFFDELLTFPQCAFKDLCDAFSQAILYLAEHTEAPHISHYAATGLSIRDGYYVGRNTSCPHPMRNPKLRRAYRR